MKTIISAFIFLISTSAFSQYYNWPCQPFSNQHYINATFCECRSGSSGDIDHFHDAVDIHLPEGEAVYSVIDGAVESIGTSNDYGINAWIRIGRYAYVHVDANPNLNVGDQVVAFQTIIGWTNPWNHIHFKDGWPGSEINAIRTTGGLSPLEDEYNPTVNDIHFYIDGTQIEFQNNRIYGSVDIVCNATDHTDNGSIGDNNGIFKIGYEVFDSTGASVFGPSFPFWFSNKPSNSYINNVYAYGSSTSTYRYTVSNNLSSNNSLNVGNWPLGNYLIRVVTFDHYMQSDTLEQWVEVVEPDEISPDPPHLLSILPSGNGFTLKWSPTSENDLVGYRLYFSYDGINWTNNHNEYDLTWEMTEFNAPSFSNNLAFFRMTAVDNAPFPNESDPSDIFVFRKYQNEKGLFLIDNYNQQGILQSHPFLKNMGLLSNEIEVGISSVHQSVFQLDTSFTIPVNYLPIVLTGNSANPIPDGLINQLNNSSYWIIGSKSTESLIATSTGSDFLQNYLGVEFTGSISVPTEFIGIDIPFDNYSSSNLITNIGIDSLNSIGSPLNESLTYPILTDSSGIILAVGVTDLPSLLSSIPLEILNENDRINYFNRAIEFLIDTTLSIPADKLVPTKPTLSFYPNPFNSNGVFHINAEVGLYQIKLFNILGQLVWQKNLSFTQSGNITFSLPKNIQHVLTSGPYFIQFDKNGKRIASNKILFLK
ncbi:MAG: T9SS type A sorting domain-containing protein [Candidatus Marinimicrobia bacterium]|jgi:hypothetical protein|nr:T9SS type A sorting domain-containing protein [Candidatus Neomarinimicrobiota bacterium]MBT5761069.1 T9SS type A sorting domain-containing protein [Candidatus Neomarinimicrobiota bacterium]MBT6517461.1 T9SS type A sorting domain-containing protein [Candidatus Neomarinimicrobiota bacterium]MBT6710639.1 T9SS type A sorting domain-containing protein [Candidatus Neomarinimicrobiota bacterium]MBT7516223.1 T9SS type A sorting domain-containing protein [Candidatus Neomarinimicrobiota bacterium]